MLWSPGARQFYGAALPKGLKAKEQGQFIRARDAANRLHDSLFPEGD